MLRVRIATRLLLALTLAGCDQGRTVPQSAHGSRFDSDDVAAYERGRRREVELSRAALELLADARSSQQRAVIEAAADPDRVTNDAARVAGMDRHGYDALVRRVDSTLVSDSRPWSDSALMRIDSLRIALVVLRSRFAAEVNQPFHARSRTKP